MNTVRRRGRPVSALQPVLNELVLGHHHFAFLRAVAEGIDVTWAATRYLVGDSDRLDPRTAKAIERDLLGRVIAAASALNDAEVQNHIEALANPADKLVDQAVGTAAKQLPSLDEFAQEFDGDMYSEHELQELYQERYGAAQRVSASEPLPSPLSRRLEAIDRLQGRLGKQALGEDPVALWLAQDLASAVRQQGVVTLNDLVTLMNRHGQSWHHRIDGLGRVRAARLTTWLGQAVAQLRHPLHPRLLGAGPSAGIGVGTALVTDLVPLEQFYVPESLDGSQGSLRCPGNNTFAAATDLQAIRAWLATLAGRSENTRVAYHRDVERFYLWCILEQRKAMSALASADCMAFQNFLQAPPAHWVCTWPAARASADWRPFRGPLTARSAARTLASVGRLLSDLVKGRYLVASPMPQLGMAADSSSPIKLDVMRSFGRPALQVISKSLVELKADAVGRRTLAMIALFQATGLRISEMAGARWADLVDLRLDDGGDVAEVIKLGLRVIGKGNVERIVPLRSGVIEALANHRVDIAPPHSDESETKSWPLIAVLRDRPGLPGTTVSDSGQPRPLSAAGIHACVKRFFKLAAKSADTSADEIEKATAHWWRHTFGHQALKASGGQMRVVQQLLGHASINTTAIYVKADFADRAGTVAGMPSILDS